MAQSTGDTDTVATKLTNGSDLHEAWQEYAKDYEHNSEALRTALRGALLEDGSVDAHQQGLAWHQVGAIALLSAAIGSTVAQSMYVFDSALVAPGLAALALLVVGGVMYAYGN